jgi:hypothetical protein
VFLLTGLKKKKDLVFICKQSNGYPYYLPAILKIAVFNHIIQGVVIRIRFA